MEKLPPPTNIKSLRSFLDHAGFYRRFIKDFSKIAKPLTQLLQKDVPFIFDEECEDAFRKIKQSLISAPIMQSPDWPFQIGPRRDFSKIADAAAGHSTAALGRPSAMASSHTAAVAPGRSPHTPAC